MKKTKKIILWAGSVLAGIIIILILAIGIFADFALKTAVETAGTQALNVGVTVDETDLGITKGTLKIRNLVIKNPPGYQHKNLLVLKNASTAVNIRSLLSDTVQIKEIILDGTEVVIEQKGISSNNLKDVLHNIKMNREKTPKEKPPEGTTKKEGKKLQVDNLEIRNTTVKVQPLAISGKAGTITFKLSPIKMQNLGSENKLTSAKLTEKIMLAIAGGIAEQGEKLPGEVLGTVVGELKKFEKLPSAFFKGGGAILKEGGKSLEQVGDVGKDVIKEGEKLGEGIKNIFKSQKEQK